MSIIWFYEQTKKKKKEQFPLDSKISPNTKFSEIASKILHFPQNVQDFLIIHHTLWYNQSLPAALLYAIDLFK